MGAMSEDMDDVLDASRAPVAGAAKTQRNHPGRPVGIHGDFGEHPVPPGKRRRRPNLELLLPLARTYDVPLDDLVGAPRTGDPRIHLRPIHHHGMTFIPLTRRAGGLQAYKMLIPSRPEPAEPTPQTHGGYEWVYVLTGRLRLLIGDRDLVLPAGEAAEFDTALPHWLGSGDGHAVELLVLFGPQGERAHVRARTRRT